MKPHGNDKRQRSSVGIARPRGRVREFLGPSWECVRVALRRDWERTRRQSNPSGGNPSGGKLDLMIPYHMSWSEVEPALRFGYAAAQRHGYKTPWSSDIDQQLEAEWQQHHGAEPWNRVRFLVYRGWLRALITMSRVVRTKEEEH